MDYFRVSKFESFGGTLFGVEFTRNGNEWTTMSVHDEQKAADREMRSYVALHEGCALWEGSLAQKIFTAQHAAEQQSSADHSKYQAEQAR